MLWQLKIRFSASDVNDLFEISKYNLDAFSEILYFLHQIEK